MIFDTALPNIADWIKCGNSISMEQITVGLYAVSACEESTMAVLLAYETEESVHELLKRLDKAIHDYYAEEIITDEVNP